MSKQRYRTYGEYSRRVRHLVYVADGWLCRMPHCYCPDGRAIDPALEGQEAPWAPSVDHIVPLALGGENTQANMRAAHRYCNNYKGGITGGHYRPSSLLAGAGPAPALDSV